MYRLNRVWCIREYLTCYTIYLVQSCVYIVKNMLFLITNRLLFWERIPPQRIWRIMLFLYLYQTYIIQYWTSKRWYAWNVIQTIELHYISTRMGRYQGRIQDFKLGGGTHLNNLRRAKGGAKIFGVFRVKNHDFTPKNHIFSNFRGSARRVRPPLDPPLDTIT